MLAQIEGLARRIARVRSHARASAEDLRCALWAMAREPVHASTLAPLLPSEGDFVPDNVAALVEAARNLDEASEVPFLEAEVFALLGRLSRGKPPLERLVQELLALGRPSAGVTASKLCELHARSQRLEQAVRGAALGRRTAIATLAEGYFEALIARPERGPRGIFTLAGPSGVGKTYLAETLARALADVEEQDYPCLRLDMSTYGFPQGAEPLFGVAPFYSGSTPGIITGYVREHPRCVLLFDGLEKAHRRTLEALLPIIDEGAAFDLSLRESVSFRDTWVLFTTTIDEEKLASANRTGVLAAIGASPTALLDTLMPRQQARLASEEGATGIPAALISRLSRGTAVLCGPLEADELARLARQEFAALGLRVEIDDNALVLFLLSLLPEVDARRVVARAHAWGLDLLRRAVADGALGSTEGSDAPIELRISPGAEALQFLESLRNKQTVQVLLVDDGDLIERRLRSKSGGSPFVVERVTAVDQVEERLLRQGFDLVLLDLTIHVEPTSAEIEPGLEMLEAIRRIRPELPVHLFSEQPSERGAFEEIVERVMRRGGARSFIPCRRDESDKQPNDDFVRDAMAAIERQRNEKIVRDLERRRRTVSFAVRFRKEDSPGTLVAEISKPRKEHLLEPPPTGSPVEYLGIPETRFEDVVGLRRAKERLLQAVRWIQDPALLGAGGSRPPRGFLLAGRPGTGKTLLARALAGETKTPLVAVSAGALQSRWSGEPEARVRELFAKAHRHAPTIVLIDEVDSIARSRDGGSQESHGLLNQLLSSIDGVRPWEVPILVLGATNLPELVDPALTRPGRLEEILQVDLPNAASRRELLARRLRGGIVPEVDLEKLAADTAGSTPAELDRIAREAVYQRLEEGRAAVTTADLEHARRLVQTGLRPDEGDLGEEERRLAAFHEAGHVVAFRELFPERRIDFVSILPSEQGAIGAVLPSRRRERSPAAEDIRKELVVLFAGRAAESLSGLPAPTAAAATDLAQSTALAERAVAEWGFDETVGPLHLDRAGVPQALWNTAWERVRHWLAEAEAKARALVVEQKYLLLALADRLVAEESLDGGAIQEIADTAAEESLGN